jgi:acyl-coenzyme A thioesterase PaaI-like protein
MILNEAQAEAVYTAMCHLNNVGGELSVTLNAHNFIKALTAEAPQNFIRVLHSGQNVKVLKVVDMRIEVKENYESQSLFAEAYNLAT